MKRISTLRTYGDVVESGPRSALVSLLRGSRLHYYWWRIRRRFARVEYWPDDGRDYTGWSARLLQPVGSMLAAGLEGRVVDYRRVRQGKLWRVAFPGTQPDRWVDYLTALPDPESVELTEPSAA